MMSHDELIVIILTTQFDGYRFAWVLHPPIVYPFNPFAINRAIKEFTFRDKWIESGHSGQLVALILEDRASSKARWRIIRKYLWTTSNAIQHRANYLINV
jgi:hypothetical protein